MRHERHISQFALKHLKQGVEAPTKPTPAPHEEKKLIPRPGEPQKRKPNKLMRLGVPVALVGLLSVGAGIYVAQEEDPTNPVTDSVSDDRFPIKLDQSSFTLISETEEEELWKNNKMLDLSTRYFTVGFPFSQNVIDQSPNLAMDERFDAILPPFIDKNEFVGIKNLKYLSGLPDGTEYKVYFNKGIYEASVVTIAIAGELLEGFKPAYTMVKVIFKNKATGINDSEQVIEGLYASLLVPKRSYPRNHSPVFEDGTPIRSGDSLLQLTTALQDWDGKGQILPHQKGQFIIRSSYQQQDPRAPIPLNTNFLRTTNGNNASWK